MALRKAVSKPPRRVRPQPASPRWRRYLNHAVLFLLACLVYANALGNGFVTDDRIQVVKNPLITSIRHIPEIFTTGVLNFFGATANYYRPIHYLVYMLLYRVNGADAFPFHLFLVLLHAANTVLVYMLVRRMLAAPEPAASGRDISLPAALASAALFAIHPIHTEVVDWIAAVPDALVTAVMVFAFWLFLRQGASPRGWRIAAHAGLYLLALLTKEPGAMLLPLYVTYEWICLGRRARALVRNAALYGAMLASLGVYLAARVLALGSLAPAQQNYHRLTPVEFLLSVIVVARQYLGELAWPAGLNYFHLFEPARGVTPAFLASLLVLAALGAVAILWSRRGRSAADAAHRPELAFGIAWIALTLAPALNITGVGPNVLAERYLYLPSVGFCWIAGLAWLWFARRNRTAAWAAGLLVLAVLAVETTARNQDWRDDRTLMEKTIRQSPAAAEPHSDLAFDYGALGDIDRAIEEARIAVGLEPNSMLFRLNLGNLLLQKDPNAAAREFQAVLKMHPNSSDAHYCLGLAWKAAGDAAAASAEYQRAIALQPANAEAIMALSGVYREAGRIQDAIDLCRRAAAARPRNPEPQIKLALLYMETRQYADVVKAAQEALRISPDFDRAYVAHYCLGIAYTRLNSPVAAVPELAEAIRLRPDFQQARQAYQEALAAAGSGAK